MLKNIIDTIEKLDHDRQLLADKSGKISMWLILMPVAVFLISAFLFLNKGNIAPVFFTTFFTTVISFLIYSFAIKSPFQRLHNQLKELLLKEFMSNHHPELQYSYFYDSQNGRDIIRKSGLIRADIYREEDVIKGSFKEASFYISEVHLLDERRQSKNTTETVTVFKGLLFTLRIPGKNFPTSQIESQHGFLSRIFSGFIENKEFNFWYDTEDFELFDLKLKPLFPFIKYLIERQGDVRIKTFGDEITILLESDMKFLDDPKPRLNKSFLDKTYYENIGKHINSLLFIAESFINNLSISEIEERLELKALELVKHHS